jgi:uncharacterized protein (DUF2062 family)
MALRALVALGLLGWMVWQGYDRRRDVWTARSWRRFGALLAAAIGGLAVAMAMALGVDRGVYAGMSPLAHQLYFYTLMALVIGSPLVTFGLLWWFARGRPERQLG